MEPIPGLEQKSSGDECRPSGIHEGRSGKLPFSPHNGCWFNCTLDAFLLRRFYILILFHFQGINLSAIMKIHNITINIFIKHYSRTQLKKKVFNIWMGDLHGLSD